MLERCGLTVVLKIGPGFYRWFLVKRYMNETVLRRYGIDGSCIVAELIHTYVACGIAFQLSEIVVGAVIDGLCGFEKTFKPCRERYVTCYALSLLREWEKVLRRVCRGRRAPYVRVDLRGGFPFLLYKNEWLVEGFISGMCSYCHGRRCLVCVECTCMPCCCAEDI